MRVWIGCLAMSSWLGTNAVFVLDSVSLPAFLPKSWKDLELCYIGGARWEEPWNLVVASQAPPPRLVV